MAQAALADPVGTIDLGRPINFGSRFFAENKYALYARLREEAPVHRGRISVVRATFVSRYDDCVSLLKDPRFLRNRSKATGGRRSPIPLPKSIVALGESMIVEDDPEHRRLRNLVKSAFTPGPIARLGDRIESLSHELLDAALKRGRVDLIPAYAQPIPVTVIQEMVGVSAEDMPRFRDTMKALTQGLTGWSVARALVFELPRAVRFVRELIEHKRSDPGPDILTGLIEAEEEGDRLSEDELVSMVFLLIIAGYETTAHLITNGVLTLLQHPEQLERLRAEPELLDSAVEEIVRFRGPIHGTKPGYAREDLTLGGVGLAKGTMVMPLLGAANHDPEVFPEPERFDIARSPNRHLGFGHGNHFCLGAQLARMETRIALRNLLERSPGLRLAVPEETLRLQNMALWHRYESLPVALS